MLSMDFAVIWALLDARKAPRSISRPVPSARPATIPRIQPTRCRSSPANQIAVKPPLVSPLPNDPDQAAKCDPCEKQCKDHALQVRRRYRLTHRYLGLCRALLQRLFDP